MITRILNLFKVYTNRITSSPLNDDDQILVDAIEEDVLENPKNWELKYWFDDGVRGRLTNKNGTQLVFQENYTKHVEINNKMLWGDVPTLVKLCSKLCREDYMNKTVAGIK